VHVRAEDGGSTPGADELDTGYHPFDSRSVKYTVGDTAVDNYEGNCRR